MIIRGYQEHPTNPYHAYAGDIRIGGVWYRAKDLSLDGVKKVIKRYKGLDTKLAFFARYTGLYLAPVDDEYLTRGEFIAPHRTAAEYDSDEYKGLSFEYTGEPSDERNYISDFDPETDLRIHNKLGKSAEDGLALAALRELAPPTEKAIIGGIEIETARGSRKGIDEFIAEHENVWLGVGCWKNANGYELDLWLFSAEPTVIDDDSTEHAFPEGCDGKALSIHTARKLYITREQWETHFSKPIQIKG